MKEHLAKKAWFPRGSSEESEGEALNERVARMRKRMEAMLGGVNRSLKERREAARKETEMEECRSALRSEAGQFGALEIESEEWPEVRSDEVLRRSMRARTQMMRV